MAACRALVLLAVLAPSLAVAQTAPDPTFGGRFGKLFCAIKGNTTCDGDFCNVEFTPANRHGVVLDFTARSYALADGTMPRPMHDIEVSEGGDRVLWVKFKADNSGGLIDHVWFKAEKAGDGYRMTAGARADLQGDRGPFAGKLGLFGTQPPAAITTLSECAPAT